LKREGISVSPLALLEKEDRGFEERRIRCLCAQFFGGFGIIEAQCNPTALVVATITARTTTSSVNLGQLNRFVFGGLSFRRIAEIGLLWSA
jgi:hypothetical protein